MKWCQFTQWKSLGGRSTLLGVWCLALVCAVLSGEGCSAIPSSGDPSLVIGPSDLLYEIDSDRCEAVDPQDEVLVVSSAHAFGFLDTNPLRVSIRGQTVSVAGDQPVVESDGAIQIVNGKLQRSSRTNNFARAVGN